MKNSDIKRMMKITKGSVLPILNQTAYIRDGWAKCTNLEISLSVPTDIKGEGVIDLAPLSKMQVGYDSAEIRDGYLFVKKGNASSKYKLAGPVDEFPIAPACNEGFGALSQSDAEAIASLVPFTGNDEERPVLCGVYVSENFVATDAHKLRWLPNGSKLRGIIIPKVAAANIAAGVVSLGESGGGSKYAEVISEKQILNFRLIEGKYPDYEAVIPKDNPVSVTVDTASFRSAVKNALNSADTSTSMVVMIAEKDMLTIRTQDIEREKEYSEQIPAQLTGATLFPIGFNGKFMLMVIEKAAEKLTFEMSASNRAMIVNKNTLMMPVMIEKMDIPAAIINPKTPTPEPTTETPIQPENKIGENLPDAEPEPEITEAEVIGDEPEQPEAEVIEEPEVIEDADVIEEAEYPAQDEDLPELLTVVENVTEKAFGVVGYTELLPEYFRNKYGSKCKILVGEERREGFLFSKKRRAQLDEAIAEIGIAYHVA